jgi:hypothetical protein
VLAAAGLALVAGPMLLGWVSLGVQFAVAGAGLPVLFGWIYLISRTGWRTNRLPRSVARCGVWIGAGSVIGTVVAAIGVALPWGSTAQYVLLAVGAAFGLPAYLAFPVWPIMLGRKVFGAPPQLVLQVATTVNGQWEALAPTDEARAGVRR